MMVYFIFLKLGCYVVNSGYFFILNVKIKTSRFQVFFQKKKILVNLGKNKISFFKFGTNLRILITLLFFQHVKIKKSNKNSIDDFAIYTLSIR